MANEKKEEINIEKTYGHLCKMSKDEFIQNFKIKEKGLTKKETIERLKRDGYNEVSQAKQKKWYNPCFSVLKFNKNLGS